MKKPRLLRDKRGIVGIEATIVLIAFVVIASALAGVVINMGFYSTQKEGHHWQGDIRGLQRPPIEWPRHRQD